MCGIFGWSFKRSAGIKQGQREVLAGVLAIANEERGDQSWGVWSKRGNTSKIEKDVGPVSGVSFAKYGLAAMVMAHTRFSTQGAIVRRNAHPFKVGNLVLAHNGVIFNHQELNQRYDRSCAVDSIHIAKHLAAGLPLEELEGYGSIEWVDLTDSTGVRLCRLANGSLSVAGIKNLLGEQVGVVWSSDSRHLYRACEAAGLNTFAYEELIEGQVYVARRGVLYRAESRLALAEWSYHGYQTDPRTSGFSNLWDEDEDRVVDMTKWLTLDAEDRANTFKWADKHGLEYMGSGRFKDKDHKNSQVVWTVYEVLDLMLDERGSTKQNVIDLVAKMGEKEVAQDKASGDDEE